jgi:hypothetical protein
MAKSRTNSRNELKAARDFGAEKVMLSQDCDVRAYYFLLRAGGIAVSSRLHAERS